MGKAEFSLDALDATIISSNFWPPIQVSFFASMVSFAYERTEMKLDRS